MSGLSGLMCGVASLGLSMSEARPILGLGGGLGLGFFGPARHSWP